jgi:hypothetical protein
METPSITAIFSKTWAGVPAIFHSRPKLYWAWLAGGALVGALAILTPAEFYVIPNGSPQIAPAVISALIGYALLLIVVVYFILADAVRAIVPGFRMTLQIFVITALLNMAFTTAVQFAAYALIIPALYIGPKLWLWTPNYLLSSGENMDVASNLTHAWRDTNNVYWPTLGFMVLTGFISMAINIAGISIGALAIQFFALSAIVMVPLMLAASMFCLALVYLGWMNWAVAIRKHADSLITAS